MRASASSKRGLPFRSSHLRKVSPKTLLTGQQELISPSTEPTVSPINPPGPLKPATVSLPRVCMLWTHDDSFSSEEVLLNFSQFPEGTIIAGDLVYVLTQGPFFSLLTNSVPADKSAPFMTPIQKIWLTSEYQTLLGIGSGSWICQRERYPFLRIHTSPKPISAGTSVMSLSPRRRALSRTWPAQVYRFVIQNCLCKHI